MVIPTSWLVDADAECRDREPRVGGRENSGEGDERDMAGTSKDMAGTRELKDT